MAERETTDLGMRPFWSGTITFGLVSIPVSLFPANRPQRTSLRMLAPDGTPLERRYYCPKDDEEISWDEIVRGYEIEKDRYVVVEDDELEAIEPRKSRDIDLRRFIDRAELSPIFFQRAYVLTPAGETTKAYRLLAEVMEKEEKAGVATFVMRGKEYLVAILADGGILRAETLRFAGEVRTPESIGLPKPKKSDAKRVKKLEAAIRKSEGKVDFGEFTDTWSESLLSLVETKRKKGDDVVEPEEEYVERGGGDAEVVDLMEVLRRSLGEGGVKKKARRASGKGKKGTGRATLEKKSREELYARAKKLDLAGRSRMSKEELIDAIAKAE